MTPFLGKAATVAALMIVPSESNWCRVGQDVMIPDGRQGPVVSVEGDLCHVLVYGEKYISRWAYYVIGPSLPRHGR